MTCFKALPLCLLFTQILHGAPAAAAPLAATKGWVVDFAAAQCVAVREYGTADRPLTLVVKAPPASDLLQLTLVRQASGEPPREVPIELKLGGSQSIQVRALEFDSGNGKLRSLRMALSADAADQFYGADAVIIKADKFEDELALSQMTKLKQAMETCVADLKVHWNTDKENALKARARSKANLASYFEDDDYPDMAVRRNKGGSVQFALLINETGQVADCTVIESSNVPSLDAQSCAVLVERARFEPAVGLDGKPAKDTVFSRITWKIAEEF
jgi:TonB family protein